MSLRTTAVLLVLSATTILSAQPQVPAAPLQTAREALIEMLTGGEKALMKHLTVEAQDFLNNPKNKPAANIAVDVPRPAVPDFQWIKRFRLAQRFLSSMSLRSTRSLKFI